MPLKLTIALRQERESVLSIKYQLFNLLTWFTSLYFVKYEFYSVVTNLESMMRDTIIILSIYGALCFAFVLFNNVYKSMK